MREIKTWIYLLAFSLLNAHELDAMTQQEWRLLLVLRDLPPDVARQCFVVLHVPLVAVLLWLGFHRSSAVASWSRRAVCAFGIIHVGLHWRLQDHPAYTFHSDLSVSLIVGYGVAGLLYLLLDAAPRLRTPRVHPGARAEGPASGGSAG
jgi:hypothetical protein